MALKAALIQALLIGLGGFGGALMRFGVNGLVQRRFGPGTFPLGTLAVNLVGCFLIGVFAGMVESRPSIPVEWRLFLVVGLLGGFTTFSTFGAEAFALLRASEYARAVAHVGAHVVVGIALVGAGYALTSR